MKSNLPIIPRSASTFLLVLLLLLSPQSTVHAAKFPSSSYHSQKILNADHPDAAAPAVAFRPRRRGGGAVGSSASSPSTTSLAMRRRRTNPEDDPPRSFPATADAVRTVSSRRRGRGGGGGERRGDDGPGGAAADAGGAPRGPRPRGTIRGGRDGTRGRHVRIVRLRRVPRVRRGRDHGHTVHPVRRGGVRGGDAPAVGAARQGRRLVRELGRAERVVFGIQQPRAAVPGGGGRRELECGHRERDDGRILESGGGAGGDVAGGGDVRGIHVRPRQVLQIPVVDFGWQFAAIVGIGVHGCARRRRRRGVLLKESPGG